MIKHKEDIELLMQEKKDFVNFLKNYNENRIEDEYDELIEGIQIKDSTCITQKKLGLTVLSVKCVKDAVFTDHQHLKQSQVIYIKKGKLLDMTSNILFTEGQTLFTPKNHLHQIKYYNEGEYIVVYLPNLNY